MDMAYGMHGQVEKNAYKVLGRNREGKWPLVRCKWRCKDNIKVDFKEIGRDDVDWIYLAEDSDPCELLWTW